MGKKRDRSEPREQRHPMATVANVSDDFIDQFNLPTLPDSIPARLEEALRARIDALFFRLKEAKSEKIKFRHLAPILAMPSYAQAQLATGSRSYTMETVNVAKTRIRVKQVTGVDAIRTFQGYRHYSGDGPGREYFKNRNTIPYSLVAGTTIYDNFGPDHDGFDYNWGLGWTIAGPDVPAQFGVEQAMGFTAAETHDELVGNTGSALTALRPAGTALIGDLRVDVVTSGEYIASGTEIRVVSVRGSRVEVRAVKSSAMADETSA